jgi:HEAT repeat protein
MRVMRLVVAIFITGLLVSSVSAIELQGQSFAELQQQLRDSRVEVRQQAAVALASLGTSAVPALIQTLKDDDPRVRGAAISGLKQIGSPAIPELDRVLDDSHALMPRFAAEILVKMGPVSVPTIVEVLRAYRPDAWNRLYEASVNLTPDVKTAAVPALLEMLRDSDSEVKERALTYLAYTYPETERALPMLIEALEGSSKVRGKAQSMLYRLKEKAVPSLVKAASSSNVELHRAAVEVLGNDTFSFPEKAAMFRQICTSDTDASVRAEAERVLRNRLGNRRGPVC